MSTTTTTRRASPPAATDQFVADRLGAAQARWNDYLGTAAADDSSPVLNPHSLYEIAGLDRNRWTIVGIEASLGETPDQVVIYAVDRHDQQNAASNTDQLSVTAFHLGASTRADKFLQQAFQRVSVRLVSTLAVDRALRVDHHAQLPQPSQT